MSVTGSPEHGPIRAGLAVADLSAGLYCALGILVALLERELATPRPLVSPHLVYSPKTQSELAILRTAAELHALYGPAALPHYIISKAASVSDLLEVALLLPGRDIPGIGPDMPTAGKKQPVAG